MSNLDGHTLGGKGSEPTGLENLIVHSDNQEVNNLFDKMRVMLQDELAQRSLGDLRARGEIVTAAETSEKSPRPDVQNRKEKPMSSSTTDTPNVGRNTLSLDDMLVIASDLGKVEAQGKDGQSKFMLKVAEAAFVGAIDVQENKHATGVDDATKLTEAYVKARNSTSIFDAKAANQRVACSKTRLLIRLGMWPKGGPGEPLSTLNDLMTCWQKLRKSPEAKKLLDAANVIQKYARMQLKRDLAMGDDELKALCYKPEPEAMTEADLLENERKKLSKARTKNLVDEATAKAIEAVCTKRLKAIATAASPTASSAVVPAAPATPSLV
jgi:hypothetical protein